MMKQLSFQQALWGLLLPLGAVISLVLMGNHIVIALLSAVVVESVYALCLRFPWQTLEDGMLQGGQKMLGAALIMILVGILISCWISSGTIPTLLYYGMKLIHPMVFLPVTFLLCLLTALATGTSWGAAGTMGIALVGIASGLGIPLPLVVGCILSGALIGDKMSPLSDSVLLTAASTDTNLFDLIVCMFYTTVPLSLVSLGVYGVWGIQFGGQGFDLESIQPLLKGLEGTFSISLVMLLPLVLVIGMSIKKIPAYCTFMCGILSGILLALVFQGASLKSVLDAAVNGFVCHSGIASLDKLLTRGGALSMAQIVFAALMAGMFSGMLDHLGIMEVLMARLRSVIRNSTSLVVVTVGVCILLMLGGGGQYTTLTLPGAAFGRIYDELDVHRTVLGRTMEDVGTMIDPIVPWSVSGIYYSGLFGISVGAYFPYAIMAFASPLVAVLNAIAGLGIFYARDAITYRPLWRRSRR
jgi:NhaC family Na+:H+ antiporter